MPAKGGVATLLGLAAPGTTSGSAGAVRPAGHDGAQTAGGTETSLVAAWAGSDENGKVKWRTSGPLGLGHGGRLVSFGATSEEGDGIFALVAGADGHTKLAVASSSRPSSRPGWEDLPAPPLTTATVAFLPGGTVDALAVRNVVLTVWALSPGSSAWVKSQVLNVPVQFGSSS